MKEMFPELIKRYDIFRDERRKLPKEDILNKAESLLHDIKEAGKTVFDPEERDFLSKIARDLGMVIYDISDVFPNVELEIPAKRMEFVDRFIEMQFITNVYCPPFLLITAPMGYGKTRLLEAAKFQLDDQNWLCIHIQLSREKSYSTKDLAYDILRQLGDKWVSNLELTTPEKLGYEVGRLIAKKITTTQKNVVILIDEVDAIAETLLQDFLNQFIKAVKEVLSIADESIRLRSIFAGRYISHWKQLGSKIPLELMALATFDFSAVYQVVENFAAKSNSKSSPDYKQEFASHLMCFTGGHPGCIAKILSKDFGYPIEKGIVSNEEEYYKTIIEPVIKEIECYITKLEETQHITGLKEIFDTLSVIRRFNPRLLKQFIDNKLIKWSKTEFDLEISLLQTYLVSKKSGFLQEDISRRLFAIRLHKTNPDHFIQICDEAISFYQSTLVDSKSHRPDIVAVELLFQKLQYLHYKHQGNKEQFFESLKEILDILATDPYSLEVMEAFIEQLNEDWEFRFMFNYLLRDRVYDEHLFNELIEKITTFKQHLQGGNHA